MVLVSPEFSNALNAMMRKDLDSWSTFWFWALIVSTAAVVVGIFAELPEVWAEVVRPTWNWIENFWNLRIKVEDFDGWGKVCPELRVFAPTDLGSGWKRFIGATALLGWIFVAVGVAGEGIAEYFVNDAETNLRAFDQAVLTETQQSSNSAAVAASLARTFADKAGAAAGKAEEKAREAEEYATPRSISDKQAALIRTRIQPLKGHKMIFFGNFHDTEISDFANRLGAILDNGIMDVSPGMWQAGMVTPSGMKFGYGKDRKADFDLIVKALDEAGVEKAEVLRKKSSTGGIPDDWLTVTFGAKH
jgi:hypothetical protein